MRNTSFHRIIIWVALIALSWSFVPTVSLAQQPTATITAMQGAVVVNGQAAAQGAVLKAGDTVETSANASVVLQLSDGSQLELGESTQVNLAELLTTATGGRVSRSRVQYSFLRAIFESNDSKKRYSGHTGIMTTKYFYTLKKDS